MKTPGSNGRKVIAGGRPETIAVNHGLMYWLLIAVIASQAAWVQPVFSADSMVEPFSARYSVYRNGKLQARTEILLAQEGENWVYKSESVGTHGMARFMKFRDFEYVEGRLDGELLLPLRYVHELKWIGPNQNSTADFDWENSAVSVTHDGDELVLDLVPGALDPMTLQLEMRRQLGQTEPDLEFILVEEDELEPARFRALPDEQLETSLGCLDTVPVEKVRKSSRRYTRSWHASALAFIPVRMEHGKTDGDHMELRITELVMDGQVIQPQPGCASMQGSRG